jgi:hypothetical protein
LFRPIRWEEDDALPFTDRIRNPTRREPMHYVIPRVFWSGFVDGVVEIYLTFTIQYERCRLARVAETASRSAVGSESKSPRRWSI